MARNSLLFADVPLRNYSLTDGQTDRRTDVQPISITCFSIADACKKPLSEKPGFLGMQWENAKFPRM